MYNSGMKPHKSIRLKGYDYSRAGAYFVTICTHNNVSIKMEFGKPKPGSLPVIVGSFKSAVARQINLMRNTPGKEVWQRNYYEHIVRNPDELDRIREYIVTNPLRWQMDKENPNGIPDEEEKKFWEDFS